MREKSVSMKVVNSRAAGIDVGSRSHFVAIGQDDDLRRIILTFTAYLRRIILIFAATTISKSA